MSIGDPQIRPASGQSVISGGDPEAPQGYRRTEVGVVPKDWDVLGICDLFEFLRTASNSRADLRASGPIAYVHYGDIHARFDHFIDFARDDVPRLVSAKNPSASRLRDGDLIVADASEDEVGVGKSVEVRNLGELEAVAGLHTILLRPRGDRSQEGYRAYLLEKEPVRAQLQRLATGLKVFGISKGALKGVRIPLPAPHEQRAIAEALSDVDGLLRALEALIAKKRATKQAAMQQLLSGRIRLPGFSGEWGTMRLGQIADIKSGATPSTHVPSYWNGDIPWCTPTDITGAGGKYLVTTERCISQDGLLSCAASLLPRGALLLCSRATIGELKIATRPVCTNQGFKSLVCKDGVSHEFAYYLVLTLKPKLVERASGSTFLEIGKRDVESIKFQLPAYGEQTAIATILSEMDAEIAALQRRRDKTHAVKQGIMQQLLTGRVRLVAPQTSTTRIDAGAETKPPHSWAFNEAVIISTLAKHFGNERYPLGRKRYQKLAYLLHRHAEGQAQGYVKKAAGPYNPSTRYGGPERIALEKDYMRKGKSGRYIGFLPGDEIAEAEGYFERWYGREVIQWLERFRYQKNDDLELLTTVDMAAEELRAEGADVDVPGVKSVISSHPEWEAKLDRAVFSDAKIAEAIEASKSLFESGGADP